MQPITSSEHQNIGVNMLRRSTILTNYKLIPWEADSFFSGTQNYKLLLIIIINNNNNIVWQHKYKSIRYTTICVN